MAKDRQKILSSMLWKGFELRPKTIRSNAWRMGEQGNEQAEDEMKCLWEHLTRKYSQQKYLRGLLLLLIFKKEELEAPQVSHFISEKVVVLLIFAISDTEL